jgi:hypothetical protein
MSSTISAAMPSTSARSSSSWRGVKPRDTMRRSRAWRGSSMLIIEPKNSRNGIGRSRMLVPLPEQNSAGWRLASTSSACRVTAQYSVSGWPMSGISGNGSSGMTMRAMGRSARSSANASSRSASGRPHQSRSERSIWSTALVGTLGSSSSAPARIRRNLTDVGVSGAHATEPGRGGPFRRDEARAAAVP